MKNYILYLLLSISLSVSSQNSVYLYDASYNKKVSDKITQYIENESNVGYPILHTSKLDNVARIRGEYYFLSVLNTAKVNKCDVGDVRSKITENIKPGEYKPLHQRYLGRPDYVKESSGLDFFEIYSDEGRKLLRYEIYEMRSRKYSYSERVPVSVIINNSFSYYKKKDGDNAYVQGYLNSPAHKSAIMDKDNVSYGIYTMSVVIEKRKGNMYDYEIFTISVVVFNQKISQI